jgi:hypothetical protein
VGGGTARSGAQLSSPVAEGAAAAVVAGAAAVGGGLGGRAPGAGPGAATGGGGRGDSSKEARCRVVLSYTEFFWEPEEEEEPEEEPEQEQKAEVEAEEELAAVALPHQQRSLDAGDAAAISDVDDEGDGERGAVHSAPPVEAGAGDDKGAAATGGHRSAGAGPPVNAAQPPPRPAAGGPPHPAAAATSSGGGRGGGSGAYPPWRPLDAAFYARMRSGLRLGETWVRAMFDGYTAQLLELCPHMALRSRGGRGGLVAAAGEAAAERGVAARAAPAAPLLPPRLVRTLALNRGRLLPLVRGGWYSRHVAECAVEDAALVAEDSGGCGDDGGSLDAHAAQPGDEGSRGADSSGGGGATLSDVARVRELAAALRCSSAGGAAALMGGGGPVSAPQLDAAAGWPFLGAAPPPQRAHPHSAAAVGLGGEATAAAAAAPPAADALGALLATLAPPAPAPPRLRLQALLVALLPERTGGLNPLACGLLHADPRVRAAAAAVLRLLAAHPHALVRGSVARLNPLLAGALQRA